MKPHAAIIRLVGALVVYFVQPLTIIAQKLPTDTIYPNHWKNAIFLEIGGNAARYSVNYQRTFGNSTKVKFNGRIGASYWKTDLSPYTALIAEAFIISGVTRNKFEAGVGIHYGIGSGFNDASGVRLPARYQTHPTFRIGYRRDMRRATFFNVSGLIIWKVPWAGFGLGKYF
jgi:hypothetical protein